MDWVIAPYHVFSVVVPYGARSVRESGDDHWGRWQGEEEIGKEGSKNQSKSKG
jgi:hypothetical protein